MNRQRRLEAIAKKRAIIHNQIQMLSASNETKIPNIIRNRNGRSQSMWKQPTQLIHQIKPAENVVTESQRVQATTPPETVPASWQTISSSTADSSTTQNNQILRTFVDPNSGSVYAIISDDGDNARDISSDPIVLTENCNEIFAIASHEQFAQPLQTVRAEDGTVMVILDGGNCGQLFEKQADGEPQLVMTNVPDGMPQVASLKSSNTLEYTSVINGETYVILQTTNGDMVLSSDTMDESLSGSKPDPLAKIVATGGVTEQIVLSASSPQITKAFDLPTNSRVPKTLPKTKIKAAASRGYTNITNTTRYCPRSKIFQGKITNSSKCVPAGSEKETTPVFFKPVFTEEKPRPFRFELPDYEDIGHDSFMSVPIPIKIESLRSETGEGN